VKARLPKNSGPKRRDELGPLGLCAVLFFLAPKFCHRGNTGYGAGLK